jgi:hypothetical protein
MDPVLQFVIEAGCLTGVVLLAAVVSTPLFGGKRWDRAMWIRAAGLLIVGLGYVAINPRGTPDLFPVVIGCTVFVVVLLALLVAITLAWRMSHREGHGELGQKTAADFGAMGLFGLAAAACLLGAVLTTIALVQALGEKSAYESAPTCPASSGALCRSQADGGVIRTWAESAKGRHWIEVNVAGRNQTIQVETAYNVWGTLVPGQRVTITFWKDHVTEVGPAGGQAMQTFDSPSFAVVPAAAFLGASLFGLLAFSVAGLVYGIKWRAALRGVDLDRVAA